jgi:hypothetical protein
MFLDVLSGFKNAILDINKCVHEPRASRRVSRNDPVEALMLALTATDTFMNRPKIGAIEV